MRLCGVCEQVLPDEEYYARVKSRCRECHKEAVRRRYHQRMQDSGFRKMERARNRARMRAKGSVPRRKRPRKHRAHYAVSNAIRDGRLTPPDRCEDCGHDFSEFRREAHHEDYDRPLDVRWLCSLCHGKRHRREAAVA